MKPVAPPLSLPIATGETVGPRKSGIAVITFRPSSVWPANALCAPPTVADAKASAATATRAAHVALRRLFIVALLGAPDRCQLEHQQQRERAAEHQHEHALRSRVGEHPAELR